MSEPCDASIISTYAFEAIFAGRDHPSVLPSITGFKVPQLIARGPAPREWVAVDGRRKRITTLFSVTDEAFRDLDERLPVIAARAAARHISRRGMVAAVRKNENSSISDLVELTVFFANLATEADTRQWGLLPDAIQIARFDLEPGEHRVELPTGAHTVGLRHGDLCIIQLFSPTPGVIKSLIPQQFLTGEI